LPAVLERRQLSKIQGVSIWHFHHRIWQTQLHKLWTSVAQLRWNLAGWSTDGRAVASWSETEPEV